MTDPCELDIRAAATLLTLRFAGWFQCRQATDPDPTDDPYGTSGYTMALAGEPPLDRQVRLQWAPGKTHLRPSDLDRERVERIRRGVTLVGVDYDGVPDAQRTRLLAGAKVRLLGATDDLNDGPVLVSRNNSVGSDDTMAFLVEPFRLDVRAPSRPDGTPALAVFAQDDLVPGHPECRAVDIAEPAVYARRLTAAFCTAGAAAAASQAIGVYDDYGYFRDRRRWLGRQIGELQARRAAGGLSADEDLALQGYRSRLYQIEHWGERVISKLASLAQWAHSVTGPRRFELDLDACGHSPLLGGTVHFDQAWRTAYWMGGWDGDLLIGWLEGSLSVPFTPDPAG